MIRFSVLDFGSFSQFLKFPDTFITPFHYYDDTDPGRRDNSIVYSRNLSDEFVLHRAKLPGTFLKNIHKIESSIIFHPLPPTNQKSSSKNNQQEAEESAPFGEVRFDNRTWSLGIYMCVIATWWTPQKIGGFRPKTT